MQSTNFFTSGERLLLLLTASYLLLFPYSATASSPPPLLGVHPLDEKYYAWEVIKCKDGSKSFTLDLVNDDFCDCLDGTDEPGTSACPRGRFYCKNLGSTPQFIFSSRVNDQICDCCDGSDEYNSGVHCANTCVMGGDVEYKSGNYNPSTKVKESKKVLDDNLWETTGLKMVIIVQILLLGGVLVFRKLLRRARFRRKRQLWDIR